MKKRFLTIALSLLTVCGAWAALPQDDARFYLIGSAADLVEFSEFVNAGNNGASARLTADIDMSSVENFTPIGKYSDGNFGGPSVNRQFSGTFDGQGHVIKNLTINVDYDLEVALFSRIGGGTVKNLSVVGATIINTSQNPRTGVIAGLLHNGTVKNVFVMADEVTAAKTGENGNLIGTNVGGTVKNCISEGSPLIGSPQSGNVSNNYTYSDLASVPAAATGELCFKMNGDQKNIVFRQTIGVDPYPTGDPASSIVYAAEMKCDGTVVTEGYTNTETLPAHVFENGICKNCQSGFEANFVSKTDGVFQIGNGAQLAWFSRYVNFGEFIYAKAALTQDIDMEGVTTMRPIGFYADSEWKQPQVTFRGEFDGKGHVIKNLTINEDSYFETGFFSRPQNATIRNLGFQNASITNTKGIRCGVLGGEVLNSQVYNTFSVGTINITTSHAQKGGLAGESSGTDFFNCYTTYEKLRASLGTLHNCYEGEAVSSTLATGELCYKLNGDQSSISFYQTLPDDTYPVPDKTHKQVYAQGEVRCDGKILSDNPTYGNEAVEIPAHKYSNVGLCTVCGHDIGAVPRAADKWLEVSTPEQLRYAMRIVNYGNEEGGDDFGLCFRLTADIDMEGIEGMEPIGLFADDTYRDQFGLTQHSYVGIFDGQGHVIKNLRIVMDNYYETGLFGRITSGGTVRNLGIENAYIENTKGIRSGVIAGEMTNRVENVYTVGDIQIITTNAQKGGIAAECYVGTLQNCYTTYDVLRTALGTLDNCYEGEQARTMAPTGELAYKLNRGTTENPRWHQTIGKDQHPKLLGNDIVYQIEGYGYANQNIEMTRPQLVDGYYQITNAKELVGFATMVNEPSLKYTGANAILMNDIDMQGVEDFSGIGSVFYANTPYGHYYGEFDGNGKKITNLVMSKPDKSSVALFGNIGAGAYIHDLQIDETCSFTGKGTTAAFVAYAGRYGDPEQTAIRFENCQNDATVTSTDNQTAGFIARSVTVTNVDPIIPIEVKMTNCMNNGDINGKAKVGGFFGCDATNVTMTGCENLGTITGTDSHVGGFMGSQDTDAKANIGLTITDCANHGNVKCATTSVGGFVGRPGVGDLVITTCMNEGDIEGAGCVAGFLGNVNGSCNVQITDSHNEGAVKAVGASESKTGGIIGNAGGPYTLKNCYNSAPVSGIAATNTGCTAGLVGVSVNGGTVDFCYNTGKVTSAGNNSGGLVGWQQNSQKQITIQNSWNVADVTVSAGENAGAILGGASGQPLVTIINCYNTGAIEGKKNTAFLAGWLGNSNASGVATAIIANCWNTGKLTNVDGSKTGYRMGGSGSNILSVTNTYDVSGSKETPQLPAPEGYTEEWLTSGEFTYFLNQKADQFVYRQNVGSNETPVLLPEAGYVAKVAENGYGTLFVADEAIKAPQGVTAYTGKIEGDVLQMTAIEGTIPAGTAVVLKGEPGFYGFTPADKAEAIAENDLQGTPASIAADGAQFILSEVDGKAGFYKAEAETIIPFAKAFLTIAAESGVKFISFGDATGINEMTTDNSQQTTVIYDLQGRRVEKATKGIYIVNGKKVLK